MSEIFVDADACPVKDEVMRVAERHRIEAPSATSNRSKRSKQRVIADR